MVEHCFDIAGVRSSILRSRTTLPPYGFRVAYASKTTETVRPKECPPKLWRRRTGENNVLYVCLIQSESFSEQRYTGFTTDLKERFKIHNAG